MLKKALTLILIIIFTISGIIVPDFRDEVYAIVSNDNPFATSDIARDENLLSAKSEPNALSSLMNIQSLEEKKKLESKITASPGKPYIVKFKNSASIQQVFDIVSAYSYKVIGKSEQRIFMLKLSDLQDFERQSADLIEYIEEDQKAELEATPSDEYYNDQWALPAIRVPEAWDMKKGSNSVYVAVIDSGVDRQHPDLMGADIRNGADYVFGGVCHFDTVGHGTNVTGIIGAQTNNAEGIAGVNWNVAIIPLQVSDLEGVIYTSDVVAAIYDAADMGCDVINMSLGGEFSTIESNAVSYAASKGCIMVAAAGNDENSDYSYPASYNRVISVGSVDSTLNHSIFSQYNDMVDAVAPGESILTTADYYTGHEYEYVYGTSFSAPHVAGVAALAVACEPKLTPAEFESLIKTTSTDLGSPGHDNYYGFGLINAENLLKHLIPTAPDGFQIVSESDKQVTIKWVKNSESDLSGYQLEYKPTTSSSWTNITVAKTAVTYAVSNLTNGAEYQFRIKAKDLSGNFSSYSEILTAVPYVAAKIAATVESTYKEGSEDSKKITVTLANGTFITVLDTNEIQLTGLPEGVSQGAITRTGNNTLTIALAGNSTVDYDVDIPAQLTIDKDQVETVKPADLNCTVTLKAIAEAKPLKPTVTFSYDGTNARQLKGINNTMEYSLDSGNSYTPATSLNQVLTGQELNNINADKDIRVRVAATLRVLASDVTTIAIAPGPSIPSVTGNDIINTVSGMTTSMEFTTDTDENVWEWSWTRYATTPAPNNLPSLNGDTKLKVRIPGKGTTMPSVFKLIEFNENEPLEVNAIYNGQNSDEGKEAGRLITITLNNGQFVSSINKDMFQLTGLPTGITKGEVKRTGNNTATIALLKNSTADYDTDYEMIVKIDKNQILPLQPENLKTSVILPAFDDPMPAPPAVTFSYKTNPGKLMGSNTAMEYSLDGGITYKTVAASNMQLTAAQLAQLQLDPTNDIRIRVKETLRAVTGEDKILNIDPIPDLPSIDASDADVNNRLEGINSTMEFSIDKGKTWKAYNGSNLPADLTGNLTIMVRIAATDSAPAGPAATYIFTATNPALAISAAYESGVAPNQRAENGSMIEVTLTNGKFLSKLTATEIKVTGLPAGISISTPVIVNNTTIRIPLKGNATAYYDIGTVITISVGKGQVLPAQPVALTTTMRLLGTAKDPAPAGIAFSFATDAKGMVTGTLSGVNNTMEYSLDGGVKYTAILTTAGSPNAITLTSAQTAVITEVKDIKVRYKSVLASSKSASYDYVIDIEKPSTPSVTNDDAANRIVGISDAMIFSTDGGKTWTKFLDTGGAGNLPKLDGYIAVMIKLFAEGYNLASSPVTLNFTSPAAPVGVDFSFDGLNAKKITGVNNTMEYSLDGGTKYTAIATTSGSPNAITLSSSQIAAITVDRDIRVRYKAVTATKAPASNVYIIEIVKPDDVPEVTYDDDANTINGIDNTMEFSIDNGKTWKAFTGSNLPANLTGNLIIKVRTFASGHDTASDPATLTFTTARPALAITADFIDDAPVPGEASYSGIIRVTLSGDNADFGTIVPAEKLTQTEIKLIGLPTGIKQGTAVRFDNKTIDIPITGTNVAYYDADKIVTVSVGKAQVMPAQAAALTAPLVFPWEHSTRSAKPENISFSFETGKITCSDASNANKLEFSLDGGKIYTAIASTSVTLSSTQISSITADNDILIRLKAIAAEKEPASEDFIIDITKPAAPDINWSDESNSITAGIDSTMEFSIDSGKTWTACIDSKTLKNNVTAKNLTGNLNIQIRLKKAGTSVAGEAKILNFTADNPLLSLSGEYSGTVEGQENGKTITVTLENGTFVSSLKTTEVVVAGLPKGVTVASKTGITKLNNTQIRILLAGNSTEDYDDEKLVTVTVGKSQLLPAPQTNPVTTQISLPLTDEETSEVPEITFSFSGDNAGRLMGITTYMEYSVDGGTTYTQATSSNVKISNAHLAAITANNGILVRVKATLRDPAGEAVLIEIAPGPEAPDVTADDQNDTVTDLDTSMEYSKNNGLTWTRFNGSNAPIVTGNATLLARLCAANDSEAGDITTLYFSEENLELSISAEYDGTALDEGNENGKTITITLTNGEFIHDNQPDWFSIQGLPEGVDFDEIQESSSNKFVFKLKGNSQEDYDSDLNIIITYGKNQVKPSQKEDLACSVMLPARVEADQYGLVKDFAPENAFDNEKVELFTADGATNTYDFTDALDTTLTAGQIVAYGLNQDGDISAIDVTNASISIAPGSLTVLSAEEATIDDTHYDLADNVVVFMYRGTAPGASDCTYDIGAIEYIRYNESVSSAASIFLINGEISAILIPQTSIISKPAGLSGIAPTSADNDDGRITGVSSAMEYRLSTESDYSLAGSDEIIGLAAGTYYVRYAADGSTPAGPYAEVVVPEYVAANLIGVIEAFTPKNGFENAKVKLLKMGGATRTYYFSDNLDAEVTAGQLVAYGLDQDGNIGAMDATNAAIAVDSDEFTVLSHTLLEVGGDSYSIDYRYFEVYTYDGNLGDSDCVYGTAWIGIINNTKGIQSPVSIYFREDEVASLLIPIARLISE